MGADGSLWVQNRWVQKEVYGCRTDGCRTDGCRWVQILCLQGLWGYGYELFTYLGACASSLRRGHANLPCIVPVLTDDLRRESNRVTAEPQTTKLVIWRLSRTVFIKRRRCVALAPRINAQYTCIKCYILARCYRTANLDL